MSGPQPDELVEEATEPEETEPEGTEPDAPEAAGTAAGDTAAGDAAQEPDAATMETELEALIADVEQLSAERDRLRDDAQRVAAEFANFRRQTEKRHTDMAEQAGAGLVERLLPVLDACDSAVQQGATDVEPIRDMFRDLLGREGLQVVDAVDAPFDPNMHEAVMREEGDPDDQRVVEILRSGYVLNGRVVRAAMVKVSG